MVASLTLNISSERSPPINEVIQSGVVPRFVEFLGRDEFSQLQVYYVAFMLFVLAVRSFLINMSFQIC